MCRVVGYRVARCVQTADESYKKQMWFGVKMLANEGQLLIRIGEDIS